MAHVLLVNGSSASIPHEKAKVIWEVLQGNIEPTPEQEKFCNNVKAIYLNWLNEDTPLSYIQANSRRIKLDILERYQVDQYGKPTRPEPGNKRIIELTKLLNKY